VLSRAPITVPGLPDSTEATQLPVSSQTGRPLIFVVEDDPDIAELECYHLEIGGFSTRWFCSSQSVIEEAVKSPPALFLLDIMVAGSDGFELCRYIRRSRSLSGVPVIFVTARVGESDRVRGLELGGDDYITKPFSPGEMVARVRAVLRRQQGPPQPEIMLLGTLEIDSASMTVRVEGSVVPTTTREFYLLSHFAKHAGRVFSREQILNAVWTESAFVTLRSVDVYVRRIREKIESDPENPRFLTTVRGAGYRFNSPK
jgi:DNA-binding response OmpR family regulator